MKRYDVVIAGGGPAGSTVAALVKIYAPHLRVLVLEKARFPRHHIGESLLAGASPVLREMGAYDKVKSYGFLEKLGATFVWGRNRTLWGFEFDQVVARLVAQGKTLPELYTRAWQVRRAEYDHLLLQHAAELGAEVREGAQAVRVLRDRGEDPASARVTGVEYRDERGVHTICINSSFRATSDGQVRAIWAFYGETYRTYLQAYRDMAAFWYSNNFTMESWWWQARRTLNRAQHGDGLTDPEVFNRLAAGYATRAESLSLFGSYPLHEARQLVAGLFGVSADTTSLEACYAGRTLRLAPRARITDGLYFYQGQVRTTRRVVSGQGKGYLDLHPAEEVLVSLLDGRHTLADLDRVSRELQALDDRHRMPVRNGIDLLVQLDGIGALAQPMDA